MEISSNTIFYCSSCREINSINATDCDCFNYFEAECSRLCLIMDSGFFKNWLMDIYGNQRILLMNFAVVRCISNIIGYIDIERDVSYYIDLITDYIYNKYVNEPVINNEYIQINSIQINPIQNTNFDTDVDTDDDMPSLIDYNDTSSMEDPLENRIIFNNLFLFENQIERNFLEKYEIICSLQELKEEQNQSINCCICYEDFNKELFVELGCNHEFCKDCFIKVVKSNIVRKPCCSYCRAEIKTIKTRTYHINLEIENLTI